MKVCLYCGKELKRRRHACGQLEWISAYNRRETCGWECGIKMKSKRIKDQGGNIDHMRDHVPFPQMARRLWK